MLKPRKMLLDLRLQRGLQHLPRSFTHDDFQRPHGLGRCLGSSLSGSLAHGRSPSRRFRLATKPYREETSVFYSIHNNRSYLEIGSGIVSPPDHVLNSDKATAGKAVQFTTDFTSAP